MKERVLALELKDAILMFEMHKWKFFEVNEDDSLVKIEVPRGSSESYVVELPYKNRQMLDEIAGTLLGEGFIQQTIRMRCSY